MLEDMESFKSHEALIINGKVSKLKAKVQRQNRMNKKKKC
jgi:hypothetical protein